MKRIISLVLSIVLLLSCVATFAFGASAAEQKLNAGDGHNYVLTTENENLALYLDSNTGDFAVVNKKTGTAWYSTPIDADSDLQAQETGNINNLKNQMVVTYITSNYQTGTVNANDKSVASVICERVGKDWVLTFYFASPQTNFAIPVLLSLKKDYLHVEIMIDKIEEMGDNRVLGVNFLKYFGAANLTDTGYAFLPDGCGSLMEFNRDMLGKYEFGVSGEGILYAPDPTKVSTNNHYTNWNEALRLPVYGMVKNGEGFLTIIDSGAAVTDIHTALSGQQDSYNTINSAIAIRDTQKRTGITGGDAHENGGSYYSNNLPENYIARYYFLDGEDADYVGMAEKYREYLIAEKGMTPVNDTVSNALNITLYGAVKKERHFLGIPYVGAEELTNYNEVSELADRLKADNVDKVFIDYSGWMAGGLETTTTTNLAANSLLGGKKAMNQMIKKFDGLKNYSLSFDVELQQFYSNNSDFDNLKDVAYGLDAAAVKIFKTRISAGGARDGRYVLYQMIHPGHMPAAASEFVDSAVKLGVKNFSFNSIGDTVYGAYNMKDVSTRDQSAAHMTAIFKNAAQKAGKDGIVSTSGGNGYATPYVDNVVNAPVYNSHNLLTSASVPFYQIVFRGYVNLASCPVNLDAEQDELILLLAETGMSLYYQLMDAKSTSFHDTDHNNLYACELDSHYDDMLANYKRMKPVYDAVGNSAIIDYKIVSDDIKVTTFQNGAKVYVNYSDEAVEIEGVKIDAKDFTVVGGGKA